MTSCKWKCCRRAEKSTSNDSRLMACDNDSCSQSVHYACLVSMLAAFDREDQFQKTICGKRCYNAVLKAERPAKNANIPKQRTAWHNDGPSNNVSSLSVLIKWMTDGNNYNRYRGGDGQTGETKQTLASEVVAAIAERRMKTLGTPKDVMNKILALEASFRATSDWLNNTGQGVQNEADLRAAILKMCPTFYDLHPVMDDSPSTHPLLLNKQSGFSYSDPDSESSSSGDENTESCRFDSVWARQPASSTSEANATTAASRTTVTENRTTSADSTSCQQLGKRSAGALRTITNGKNRTKKQRTTLPKHGKLLALKEAQLTQQKTIELEKLSIKREDLLLRQQRSAKDVQESEARIAEANANALKLQEETKHCRMQRIVALLRERTKLKAEGVSQDELDLILPLPLRSPASLGFSAGTRATDYDELHLQHF